MKLYRIRFQTSELQPPPYAHAIEIKIELSKEKLKYEFELSYLDRDQLTEEEILEEGFSIDDSLHLRGALGQNWANNFENILRKTEKTFPTELQESEDFWEIMFEKEAFYPKNVKQWKSFIEEFHQAVLEQNTLERPLEIQVWRIDPSQTVKYKFLGSFEKREFKLTANNRVVKNFDFSKLNSFLKDYYSGDFITEKAFESLPKKQGIHLEFGDGMWYLLGEALLVKPSKITSWIESHP